MNSEHFYRQKLDDNLKNYNKIFLISAECMELIIHYTNRLPKEIFDNIMIMTTESKYERLTSVKLVSQEEYSIIRSLYYTYEFSDKFCLIESTEKFGILKNYIDINIITPIEAVRAIFI